MQSLFDAGIVSIVVHDTITRPGQSVFRTSLVPLTVSALAGLLGMLALTQIYRAGLMIPAPVEIMYGEAIIHDQAARIVRGEPLYQSLSGPPYAVAAYTPVYYHLVAALQAIWGPGFAPGRMVSLVAGLGVAAIVFRVTSRSTADWKAGLFAALMLLGLGLPSTTPWFALYKEDVLGVLFGMGALVILTGGSTFPRVWAAAALAALAILTKQTHAGAALTLCAWLLWYDRRAGLQFSAILGTLVFATSAYFELTTGAYLANTVFANVNPFLVAALVSNLATLGTYLGLPLMVAGLTVLRGRFSDHGRTESLLTWSWVGSALPLVGLAKVGSNHNYWIELAAVTAILATLGIWSALRDGGHLVAHGPGARRGLASHLLLVLVPLVIGLAALSRISIAVPPDSELAEIRAIVRAEPSSILAVPLDVLTLAGRSIELEPYLYSILEQEGRWDSAPLLDRIRSGEIGLVVADHLLDVPGPSYHGYPHWPASVLAAVRETMTLDAVVGPYHLYRH